MSCRFISSSLVTALFVSLIAVSPTLAGPPLLCHPFDIGTARSLPWDDAGGWWPGRADYRVANLVADTEALLTPTTPIIVRMETLRRAAIYASRDRQVAEQLLARFLQRASTAKKESADALAHLDAAYVVEAFRQIRGLSYDNKFRGGVQALQTLNLDVDGYAMMMTSLAARPNDPTLEFAAALIASGTRDRAAYLKHAEKARAGVSQDALLARNIKQIS